MSQPELSTVTLRIRQDEFNYGMSPSTNVLPYKRIVGVHFPYGHTGTDYDIAHRRGIKPNGSSVDDLSVDLPVDFAEKFNTAVSTLVRHLFFDCHWFAWEMSKADCYLGGDSPRFASIIGKEPVDNLALGAVGLVANMTYRGIQHSLIGFSEAEGTGLQVMSHRGELGIARHQDVIKWYAGRYTETPRVELYRGS